MATFLEIEDSTARPRKVLLGRTGPTILLICFLLDVSLRFVPPPLITFRAWEGVRLLRTGPEPFVPNRIYRNSRSYGDLAAMGNLPRLRQYREEVFHVDVEGYRNRRKVVKPFAGILLIGDSFTVGSGVADEQSLGEQLNRMSNRPSFNGAAAASFWDLFNKLQMTHGLVVWQVSERSPIPVAVQSFAEPEHGWRGRLIHSVIGDDRTDALIRMISYVQALIDYSPLQILSGRIVKLLQNDKILPNPYREKVVSAQLRNGRKILFLPSELENYERERPTDPEFFVKLRTQLQAKGIGLLVLLVPDKYVVYHDLVVPISSRTERRLFLDIVEQRLAAANVPVVNLTSYFREQAESMLARDRYIYWLDDTHWNAEGIREAAQAIISSEAFAEAFPR